MGDVTILCISSECKGQPLIIAAREAGARVLLLTEEKKANADWPNDHIDERFLMPDLRQREDVLKAVSYLARSRRVDGVVPLDDYEVGTAAALRAHLRLPGMDESTARYFRDKLAMRQGADAIGLPVPPFSGLFNYDALRAYMAEVPAPWVLKPRFEAGAIGIRKLHDSEQVWRALDDLGDLQSSYLLEQFIPGDVYHVDSLWWDGRMQLSLASRYGRPPLSVSHEGGVFVTRTLPPESAESTELTALTAKLLPALGLRDGVGHTEFIRAVDGTFYFLETAARVGGAHISDLVEHASGVNLWREWGRVVVARLRGDRYQLPAAHALSGGLLICLAQQMWPDLSSYDAPEVVWRLRKAYHAGLIVAAPESGRVAGLLEEYADRFAREFLTTGPQQAVHRTQA